MSAYRPVFHQAGAGSVANSKLLGAEACSLTAASDQLFDLSLARGCTWPEWPVGDLGQARTWTSDPLS